MCQKAYSASPCIEERRAGLTSSLRDNSRSMSITTVAEYIETEAISLRIAELGVDYGQGFAIGRPVPIEQVLGDLALYEAMAQQESTSG